MAVVNGYCTVEELTDHMEDGGGQLDTVQLERAINAASRWVDHWCARRFWRDAAVAVRTYRPDDPDHTLAWVDDISTTTGLVVRTDDNADGVYETTWTLDVDYQLAPANAGVVGAGSTADAHAWWRLEAINTRTWPRHARRRPLQVTARWGWSAVPSEVTQATLIRATSLYRRRDAQLGITGTSEMGSMPMRVGRYDPDVEALLHPLRRRRVRTLDYTPQRHSLFHTGGPRHP